ncbi:MAG TPA: hypothetical protein VOA87_12280 [Thermoanaerobaculia bacterium]|nr:hypothetical protein [Thermoanaerobaculia bacterium]
MQITFLTLFLGLVSGRLPVELQVTGPVAAVELTLDGQAAGRIAAPPWKATVDLGPLAPHELVARALDDKGAELASARQWINLPRAPAELALGLEGAAGGKPGAVRMTWQSVTNSSPTAVTLSFDGSPLAVDGQGRAALPAYRSDSAHVLSAEVRFSPALAARKDVAFGGDWGSEVSTELTAVPVRIRRGARLPPADALQGWFTADGKPLRAAAVEAGPARLLVVRDPSARSTLARLGSAAQKRFEARDHRIIRQITGATGSDLALAEADRVRFIWPTAKPFPGEGVTSELFESSQEFPTNGAGGLYWLLSRVLHDGDGAGEPRIADATAVAGLQALAGHHARAVLLVLGDGLFDASRYDPAALRRYLATIRVPLHVWSVTGLPKGPAAAAWGEVEDASSMSKLLKAAEGLRSDLESQRIVWVEGLHLPQSITLTPAGAAAAELVAAAPPPR